MKTLTQLFKEHLQVAVITRSLPNTTEITVDDALKFTVKDWLEQHRHVPTYNLADCENNLKREIENNFLDRLLKECSVERDGAVKP